MKDVLPTPVSKEGWPHFISEFMVQYFLPLYNSIKKGQPYPRTNEETAEAIRDTGMLLYYGAITTATAKKCFRVWWDTGVSIEEQNRKGSIIKLTNSLCYGYICFTVALKNKDVVQGCYSGASKKYGMLMGQALKMSNDRADPEIIKEMLNSIISCSPDIDWDRVEAFLDQPPEVIEGNFY